MIMIKVLYLPFNSLCSDILGKTEKLKSNIYLNCLINSQGTTDCRQINGKDIIQVASRLVLNTVFSPL